MRPCWVYWASKKCTKNKPEIMLPICEICGKKHAGLCSNISEARPRLVMLTFLGRVDRWAYLETTEALQTSRFRQPFTLTKIPFDGTFTDFYLDREDVASPTSRKP